MNFEFKFFEFGLLKVVFIKLLEGEDVKNMFIVVLLVLLLVEIVEFLVEVK